MIWHGPIFCILVLFFEKLSRLDPRRHKLIFELFYIWTLGDINSSLDSGIGAMTHDAELTRLSAMTHSAEVYASGALRHESPHAKGVDTSALESRHRES